MIVSEYLDMICLIIVREDSVVVIIQLHLNPILLSTLLYNICLYYHIYYNLQALLA